LIDYFVCIVIHTMTSQTKQSVKLLMTPGLLTYFLT